MPSHAQPFGILTMNHALLLHRHMTRVVAAVMAHLLPFALAMPIAAGPPEPADPEAHFPEDYYFKHPSAKGIPVRDHMRIYAYDKPWALDHDTPAYDSVRQVLARDRDFIVWWQDALKKVPRFARMDVRDRELPTEEAIGDHRIALHAVRGERESFQIAVYRRYENPVTVERLKMTTLETSQGAMIAADRVALNQVGYLNRTKPDPLYPLDDGTPRWPEATGAFENLHFWITVDVPRDAEPGRYAGALEITVNGERFELPVRLTVSPVTLPRQTAVEMQLFAARTSDIKAMYPDRDARAVLEEEVFPLLAANRIAHARPWTETPDVDEMGAEGAVELFERWGTYWDEQGLPLNDISGLFPRAPQDQPKRTKELLELYLPVIEAHGWADRSYVRLPMDEQEVAEVNVQAAAFWAEHAPTLRTHQTIGGFFAEDEDAEGRLNALKASYDESLDILSLYRSGYQINQPHLKPWFDDFVNQGGHLSWYYHQYMGVGETAMAPRTFIWQMFREDVQMATWWSALTMWSSNWGSSRDRIIWREPRGFGRPRTAGAPTGNTLGFYPGKEQVLSGIRFEIIRDGIEDYDLLTKLAQRVEDLEASDVDDALLEKARAVLAVPEELLVPDKPYPLNTLRTEREFDPELPWRIAFAAYRSRVIETLEELQDAP